MFISIFGSVRRKAGWVHETWANGSIVGETKLKPVINPITL